MQTMNEKHEYIDDSNVTWNRVFESPNATIDSFAKLNPLDNRGFIKQTAKVGMTVGDMWDESKRLSERRTALFGKDPVKEGVEKAYEKRTGKKHPHAKTPTSKLFDLK